MHKPMHMSMYKPQLVWPTQNLFAHNNVNMQCSFLPAQAKKASGKCPFLQAKTQTKTNVQDAILAQPMDVEDLAKLGRSKLVCPYYTARSAVPDAQLVLLPYSALLAQVSHTQASTWCVCCMSPSEEGTSR